MQDVNYLVFVNTKTNVVYADIFYGSHTVKEHYKDTLKQNLKFYPELEFISAVDRATLNHAFRGALWTHGKIGILDKKSHPLVELLFYPDTDKGTDGLATSIVYRVVSNSTFRHIFLPFNADQFKILSNQFITEYCANYSIDGLTIDSWNTHYNRYGNGSLNKKENITVLHRDTFSKCYLNALEFFYNLNKKMEVIDDRARISDIQAEFVSPVDREGNNRKKPAVALYLERYSAGSEVGSKSIFESSVKYYLDEFIYLYDMKNVMTAIDLVIEELDNLRPDERYFFRGFLYEPMKLDGDSWRIHTLPLEVSAKVLSRMGTESALDNPLSGNKTALNKFF
jgi:hypothetical protein